MSRSYKKPFFAVACYFSNKKDKTIAHKHFRAKEKEEMRNILDDEDKLPIRMREVSNTWEFSSDGLAQYKGDEVEKCKELFGWLKWFKK